MNYIRTILEIALVILCIFLYRRNITPSSNVVVPTLSKVTTYTKNNQTFSQIKAVTANADDDKHFQDSIKKNINSPLSAIKEVTTYTTVVDTIFVVKPTLDSTKSILTQCKKDNYIDICSEYDLKANIGTISVKSIDTITSVLSSRKRLLNPEEYTVTLNNKNKYNKIVEGSSISFQEKRPIIDFGLQAGYNPFTQKTYIGIGAQLHIFSIKSK